MINERETVLEFLREAGRKGGNAGTEAQRAGRVRGGLARKGSTPTEETRAKLAAAQQARRERERLARLVAQEEEGGNTNV